MFILLLVSLAPCVAVLVLHCQSSSSIYPDISRTSSRMDALLMPADGRRAQRQRVGGSAAEEQAQAQLQREILTLVAQLALKLDLDVRELRAATITTVVAKRADPIIEAGQNEMTSFEERLKELREQKADTAEAGNKQVRLWARIVDTIVKTDHGPELKQAIDTLKEYHAAATTTT